MRQKLSPVVVVLAWLTLALILAPVLALGLRVPWGDLGTIATSAETRQLLEVTLASAVIATLVALGLGLPLALWMQRLRRGAFLARGLVLLPLALPPVVAGLALSAFIGRRGVAAPLLDLLGWQFAFAFPGVVASHVYIALPFVVITLDAALRQLDRNITESAVAVGIPRGQILWRITLPAIAPALATAAGLAFARSLGEFGTTLTFAGSMPGVTRTMPLGIYLAREVEQSVAYGLAAILIFLAVVALALSTLPQLLRKKPAEPKPRAQAPVDQARLTALTKPDQPKASAQFPTGKTTALIGPNGAGKTTLVRSLVAPGAVLLTQHPGLPHTTTALGAVAMVTDKAAELLDAAGLSELAQVPVTELSTGQAAQVALVRALAPRPGMLLLDEPLSAIDAPTSAQWRSLLRAASQDRTTVIITHDTADIFDLADSVAVLERGELRGLKTVADEAALPTTEFSAHLMGKARREGTAVGAAREGAPAEVRTPSGTIHGTIHGIAATDLEAGSAAIAVYPLDAPDQVRIFSA
ncbi:ATP-binding cassette domain-containing protein [Corynebacterium riegelii]|uniref:ATP-binding cassette domain-containing protein n=1 Tax=Corynebacterium riegelii TaxID=156976 RepID=UPI0023F1175D|nr:ATP-binding cassette domain-containing protein [Corynebacterium riegelii]